MSQGGRASKVGFIAFVTMLFSLPPVAAAHQGEAPDDPLIPDTGIFGAAEPAADQFAAAALSGSASAAGFVLSTVWSGLDNPIATEFAPDGRAFVAEKSGVIKAFDSISDPTPVTVADLSNNVHDYWDRGLLGLAVDPGFPGNPYLYAMYTLDVGNSWNDGCPSPPGPTDSGCVVDGRLSRLQVDPATNQQVGPEQVLVENRWCAQYPSHTVGDLVFDATGALLATAGDGASFGFTDYGQGGGTGGTPVNPCNDPDPTPSGDTPTPPDAEGGALRSQDVLTMADPLSYDGAVIRVDPATGNALADNPLYGGATSDDDRLIAHGLRNPFRAVARPGSSEVWIGDVGWGTWEEINVIDNPADGTVENFGWPCWEGNPRHSGYDGLDLDLCEGLYDGSIPSNITNAYYPYRHGPAPDPTGCPGNGGSVSGLEFSQSSTYPAAYQDALFFADYSYGCVWAMFADGGGDPDPGQISTFVSDVGVVDLTSAPNGDLVITDLDSDSVLRVSTSAPGGCAAETETVEAETGTLLGSFQTGSDSAASGGAYVHSPNGAGKTFTFDPTRGVTFCFDVASADTYRIAAGVHAANGGSNSFYVQVDGGPAWLWDLTLDTTYAEQFVRDRATGEIEVTLGPGEHTIGLYLREDGTRIDTIRLDPVGGPANLPPTPTVSQPLPSLTWDVGDTIAFSGSATDPEDGPLPASALEWNFLLHHCDAPGDCHVHTIETRTGVSSGTFVAVDHELPSHLEIELKATDSGGLSATDSVEIQPNVVDISLESVPSGLLLTAGGEHTAATPFVHQAIVGGAVEVTAPTPQSLGGVGYDYDSWSDGGARSHIITAPATPLTLTATYTEGAPPTCGGLVQEAEAGTVLGSFAQGADPGASGGAYVHAPPGSGNTSTFSPANGVEFCVTVTLGGDYQIQGDVYAEDPGSNSFFVQVDGGTPWLWDLDLNTSYDSQLVKDRATGLVTIPLSPGEHTVGVYLREDAARLDRIEMVNIGGGGPPPCGGLVQEAEDGTLRGTFTTDLDPAASNGAYVHAPQGSGSSGSFSTVNGVELCVDVTTAGTYRILGDVYAEDPGSNSFWVQVDGGDVWLWDIGLNTTYESQFVQDRAPGTTSVALGVGSHTIGIYLREDGTRIDKIELVNIG